MQSRFLLDVVVRKSSAVFQLLASKNETLLVWWDALLVLDLALDVVDCVARFHLEGDCFAREGLDEAVVRMLVEGALIGYVWYSRTYICTATFVSTVS